MKININWAKLGSSLGYVIATGALSTVVTPQYKQYVALGAIIVGIIHPSPFEVSDVEKTIVSESLGRIDTAGIADEIAANIPAATTESTVAHD